MWECVRMCVYIGERQEWGGWGGFFLSTVEAEVIKCSDGVELQAVFLWLWASY